MFTTAKVSEIERDRITATFDTDKNEFVIHVPVHPDRKTKNEKAILLGTSRGAQPLLDAKGNAFTENGRVVRLNLNLTL